MDLRFVNRNLKHLRIGVTRAIVGEQRHSEVSEVSAKIVRDAQAQFSPSVITHLQRRVGGYRHRPVIVVGSVIGLVDHPMHPCER